MTFDVFLQLLIASWIIGSTNDEAWTSRGTIGSRAGGTEAVTPLHITSRETLRVRP